VLYADSPAPRRRYVAYPAHDDRDFEFAKKFEPIVQVIKEGGKEAAAALLEASTAGVMVNWPVRRYEIDRGKEKPCNLTWRKGGGTAVGDWVFRGSAI